MTTLNKEIYIFVDDAGIVAMMPNFDERPQSKIEIMSIVAKAEYTTKQPKCTSSYRLLQNEPPRGKTNNLHLRKQRRRSAPLFSLLG